MPRLTTLTTALAASLAVLNPVTNAQEGQKPIVPDDYECTHPPYKINIFSRSPLVIYISDFITPSEREHLLGLANPSFTRSSVVDEEGRTSQNTLRTSQSTSVPRDAVVRCVQDRALLFQGLSPSSSSSSSPSSSSSALLEPLQLVKYGPGEHYHFHTDWFTDPAGATAPNGGNRASSFFGYMHVGNDTTGGGTNFPLLDAPRYGSEGGGGEGVAGADSYDHWWCRYIDCDAEWEDGVTFRPVEGNAVYWENLGEGGEGDMRTLHAGLPVTTGSKVGMNIWTRQAPLSEAIRGQDV